MTNCGKIGDYALIGDCRSAALVSRTGSIDWLCLPHFSSPSVFGAILDHADGGHFSIGIDGQHTCTRRYIDGTNVLQTTLRSASGAVCITDVMPIPRCTVLEPMCEVLRRIQCIDGSVRLRVEIAPKPGYGLREARLERRAPGDWAWTWGNNWMRLASDCALTSAGDTLAGEVVMQAGQQVWLSLGYVKGDVGVLAPLGDAALERLEATSRWWRAWSGRAHYQGRYREQVLRSALVLKLMTFCLSGAVIAAPSTSLPEALGADRNWDYRYCWLRDAALTMRALTGLGYFDEARRFLDWLLHATRLTWPRLGVLYDLYGRPEIAEAELPHWRGFCDSRPVRTGNAAHHQLQLDVYGAVCFAARDFWRAAGGLAPSEARLIRGFGKVAGREWQQPDHGIWEIRGPRRHYTFSKVMCWAALDSVSELAEAGVVRKLSRIEGARDAVREVVEARGFNERAQSYVSVLDGDRADASLLLLGTLGYQDPASPRMRSTFAYVQQRLARNGLLMRYEDDTDGFASREGAFGICSFWALDALARRGETLAARRSFEHVMAFSNDLQLFAEEIDPDTGELLGNFPQAYTHIGLINAALTLARAEAAA
jgi:GH15 family glucan-1,4-alpha-glucosidase